MPATKEQVEQLEARVNRMEKKLDRAIKILENVDLNLNIVHLKIDYLGTRLLAPNEVREMKKIA